MSTDDTHRIISIVLPPGYASGKAFADDCGVEIVEQHPTPDRSPIEPQPGDTIAFTRGKGRYAGVIESITESDCLLTNGDWLIAYKKYNPRVIERGVCSEITVNAGGVMGEGPAAETATTGTSYAGSGVILDGGSSDAESGHYTAPFPAPLFTPERRREVVEEMATVIDEARSTPHEDRRIVRAEAALSVIEKLLSKEEL